MVPRVDHTALKFNQSMIIGLLVIAFLVDLHWLVAFVAAVMFVGTLWPGAGLFKLVYGRLLRPIGVLQPQIVAEDPQPHLFAQGLGALVLVASTLCFVVGAPLAAWLLVGIVIILAAVNLFFAFCAGCFIYFQLERRGIHPSLPQWRST